MKSKEEIEQLVLEKFKHRMYNPFFNVAFVEGYMQCQEDMDDKKYTEEDMLKAFIAGVKCESKNGKNFDQFIKNYE